MRFDALLTEHDERNLEELYHYIAAHDTPGNAARVLDRIEKAPQALSAFPERGSHPKELLALGIREYRQTLFKPYRLIYRIVGHKVYVYLIVDGRRDMQALLARRLFGA
jgi:toxin ParE1/3/4